MHLNLLIGVIFSNIFLISSDYIIETNECKLPNFASNSQESLAYVVPVGRQAYIPCPNPEVLSYINVANNVPTLYLKITKLYQKYKISIKCCYSEITRNGTEDEPDIGISTSECIPVQKPIKLQTEELNTIKVECRNEFGVVYENVHSPIFITKEIHDKIKAGLPPPPKGRKKISVLFVVIDSISRLNFERTMPVTKNFLNHREFIEFKGYNKVDDNTFPNAMALLSGLNLKQVYSWYNPREVGKLDECPMVWYDFRNSGYATAYAEDWANFTTFNYLKKGFSEPPTDYYFKPYMEAAETLNITFQDNLPYCAGPETEGERILKLAKDFATTFLDQPSFGIFWMNTFSHNNIHSPIGMDGKMANFFQDLQNVGVLDQSIVILLSDHGIRFGKYRETIQGWFEERLPLLSISVPSRFKREYREKYRNLKNNAEKLTSTYDLYMTLQDVLNMSLSEYNVTNSLACPTCQSLFSDIPEERSCRMAGVPEAWCTCIGNFTTDDPRITEETNNRAKELALREIRRIEQNEPYSIPKSTAIVNILSSNVNVDRLRKSYLLFVTQTDTGAVYQIFFRIRGDPVQFVRIVKTILLYYAAPPPETNQNETR